MAGGKTLCLNMIVKNEMANLPRCLAAVATHITCWVIGDTGSTDGTQAFIRGFFAERGIPGELHSYPFDNFEQARNTALEKAYGSDLAYDYLLLDDADMELVVEDDGFRGRLEAPAYRVVQRSTGGLVYWNTRLLRRDSGARYRGVTHEFIDLPEPAAGLHGVWYKDHASGANRVDKFERDIRLLTKALETEPENDRYWFYLAQSYRDAGQTKLAAETYARRAGMGGWDEEAWNARLQEGRCLRALGDDAGFLRAALAAFNQRPQRAEPLHDLARYYRERGMNDASVLFSEPGLPMKQPSGDLLFLEDYVYTAGLKEEFSIAANYARDPDRKARGRAACDWLALSREISDGPRDLARSNLYYYTEPLSALLPSFIAQRIAFNAPDGYRPLNPSVARHGQQIVMVQRTANFILTDAGDYETSDGLPINTRNFLLRLNDELAIESSLEILPPVDMPPPAFDRVLGFEDARLFAWRDALWCSATVRELSQDGTCQQVLACIERIDAELCRLMDWRVLHAEGPRDHQKNWMPQVAGDALRFIYLCDPTRILDEQARTVVETVPPIAADRFRGGSQAIAFCGGWLALIHEAETRLQTGKRLYQHRFVWFDRSNTLRGVSRRFIFNQKGIEFAAGMAWHPDGKRLILSYGVGDCEAWLATVDATEVRDLMQDVTRLPTGIAGGPTITIPADMLDATIHDNIEPAAARSENSPGVIPIAPSDPCSGADAVRSTADRFLELAPFLRAVDRPDQRRALSREFDARIGRFLNGADALPQIHCFYEVLSDTAQHHALIAATTSMRAMGHPVRIWSYSPEKLDFLQSHGIELRRADDVVPRGLFQRIVDGSEIRYFSDVFRYAVLYEYGGLWMDSDVVMLRPFPFQGEHFLNLQWRGGHAGHFVCGNVMYGKPFSRHFRNLYEMSIARTLSGGEWKFGNVGPKLLSDYVISDEGRDLRKWLFSPMLFNPIDWTEVDRFSQPITELADYLNDERVFGVHLWNARTNARSQDEGASLISLLTDPLRGFPGFTELADRFDTDKNRHSGNRHCYARIYDQLLAPRRLAVRRLMEIGLCRGLAEGKQTEMPSVALWQSYFPFCHVIGVDLTDFSRFNDERFTSVVCDQSKLNEVRTVAAQTEPGSLDVIIDDGSHASYDEQMTFRQLFPLLAEGGWYFIEDLDWQPPGEDPSKIALTKHLFREIQRHGRARSMDPLGISELADQFSEILFFDSHYELVRAGLLGGLVAIRKRGEVAFVH